MTPSNYSDVEILDAVQRYMFGSQNPDLIGYRTQSLERDLAYKHIFMWSMRHLCQLGRMQNARVLDVGCGFGWQALAISMIGGNSVIASDILPSMIDGARDCVRSLQQEGKYRFEVEPLQGDICELDFPDGSFDAIYSIEAIEHVRDIDAMFKNCVRLLAPGGSIALMNDCNILHPGTKNELEATFNKRENSWEWCAYLRSIRPIEHANAKPFAVVRKEIVKAANPGLDEKTVDSIVWASAGMLKPQIETLASTYKLGTTLPKRPETDWCRDPVTGEYAERLFDPYILANKFTERGLNTKIMHCFRRQPLRMVNGIQSRAINKLLFAVKPTFVILAQKPT